MGSSFTHLLVVPLGFPPNTPKRKGQKLVTVRKKMAEKDRLRTKKIQVFVTEAELQYTRDKAKSCDLTMSEYIRQIIQKGLVVKLETFDIKGMSVELNRIGTNINQIAKHVNEKGGDYDKQDMQNLIQEFREMESFAYKKALGMDEGVKKYLDDIVTIYGKEFLEEYLENLK